MRGVHHQRVRWRFIEIFLHVVTGRGVAGVLSSASFACPAGTTSLRF
ncbi:MAG: hypothetical protein JF601_10915 [Acidobacteria bacterium]|nr:hypothetical protein [Acidobacteriota bacterium]